MDEKIDPKDIIDFHSERIRQRPIDIEKKLPVVTLDDSDLEVKLPGKHTPIHIPRWKEIPDYCEQYRPVFKRPHSYLMYQEPAPEEWNGKVEYELDSEDEVFVENLRKEMHCKELSDERFEAVIDRLEKKSFQLGSKRLQAAVQTSPDTDDVPCGVCGDRDFDEGNQIVFCDGCNVAVHQECYGVERIPEGPWFCDRCTSENPDSVRCELCPMEIGAFKRCVDPPGASPTRAGQRWAHLICALYIPGPRVVDTRRMGPIAGLEQVDTARRALVCSVCGVKAGVCIQCSEPRCYAAFHATCALLHGLWMETRDDRLLHYCRKHSDQRHEQELQKRIRDGTFLLDSARALGRHEATGKAARKLQLPGPVLQRVFEYWVQKRQRNGNQPLLPRLRLLAEEHLVAVIPISSQMKAHLNSNQLFMKLVYLRQELERLRTLLDLVRKREQYKRESTELSMRLFDLRLAQLTAEARARSARSASPCPVRGSASSVPARDRRPAPPDSRKRRRSLPASTPNHRSKHRRRSEEPEEPEEKEEEEEEEEEDEKESEEEEEESEGKEREEGQEEEEEEEEDSEEEEGSKEEADEEEQEEEEEEEAEESEEESKSKSADETRRQEQARAPAASVPTNGSVTEPLSMNEVRVCRRVLEACMADAGGEARELPKFERVAHRVARVDYRAAVKALTRAGRLLYAAGGSGGGSRYFLPAPLTLRNLLSWVRSIERKQGKKHKRSPARPPASPRTRTTSPSCAACPRRAPQKAGPPAVLYGRGCRPFEQRL